MKKKFQKLKLRQLDEKIANTSIQKSFIPTIGWIKEVRTTLGMTHKQLAKRLNVSAPTVANYEKSEVRGTINLKTMKKVAEALQCKLSYAVVPVISFENIIEEQSMKAAQKIFKTASHTMNLENQTVGEKENIYQYKELIDELGDNPKKKIWDYEV